MKILVVAMFVIFNFCQFVTAETHAQDLLSYLESPDNNKPKRLPIDLEKSPRREELSPKVESRSKSSEEKVRQLLLDDIQKSVKKVPPKNAADPDDEFREVVTGIWDWILGRMRRFAKNLTSMATKLISL